ncbi:hypothetical protein PsorP6_007750 [Peronosclerospora sorghi]|uniref:Uncharacterized protein n=1 Tax=Peronosclerospora sorghi TaxID=230839 RepID=A0ACC0W8J9_9STRA|nr:hypothetical protein PsorP6_007750 [Peronosclerospora sorghi]
MVLTSICKSPSPATKQRFAGVTGLLEQLRTQSVVPEAAATIFPHVLPCLSDHNSKITFNALEILELLVTRVAESTLLSYLNLLWTSLEERLGDNKIHVREKAVDVVVRISLVLDVSTVLEKLQQCMKHKNWRAREQSLHAICRILEKHKLFEEKQSQLLDDVLKLLEDSSKDVRDATMTTLVKFYTYIGSSFLITLQDKKIRSGQMTTLKERCEQSFYPNKNSVGASNTVPSHDVASVLGHVNGLEYYLWLQTYHGIYAPNSSLPQALASMFSSSDIQTSSPSLSSVSRYLKSVKNRNLSGAMDTAAAIANEIQTSQESTKSSKVKHESSLYGASGDDISDKEIQQQLGVVYDKLESENDWDKRVDGLKTLQNFAVRCAKASNSSALVSLSHNLLPIRERLCQQVCDLRSTVSRVACETIQILAESLQDEFNAHAEICLCNLLKATYVTIQVISTAANTTIRSIITSTRNGFVRVIPKFIECAQSRNHVLRHYAVCYLTLTLERWSTSFLSKHSDLFVPILPAILRDALADVRAQARKCYWSFYNLFPDEAECVFARLDASTQKNLNDDPSKFTSKAARQIEYRSLAIPSPQKSEATRSGLRTINTNTSQPPLRTPIASNSSANLMSGEAATSKLPRRVCEGDATVENAHSSRMLSGGPVRVGIASGSKLSVAEDSSVLTTDNKKSAVTGPLRVRNVPKSVPTTNAGVESLYTSRQVPSSAGSHIGLNPAFKVQRVQCTAEPQHPTPTDNSVGKSTGPKRLLVSSVAPPTVSIASNLRANVSSKADVGVKKLKRIEQAKLAVAPVVDQLEVALQSIESEFWSTRLEGADYLGSLLRKRASQISDSSPGDYSVDSRILLAFIKHLSDAHYRVSQCVLKNFLPLLKLLNDGQTLVPHLKTILPKLFQKFIDTKEAVRLMAKESLEHIAATIDSVTLSAIVISMLGEGSNMKVKAAMCSYLRDLMPGAADYIKSGSNYSHMRTFLLKIALLMDADVPVSVSSACGDLISMAAQLYGREMDKAVALLPPSKRLVVSKVLKSKKIVLNTNNLQKPPVLSIAPSETQSCQENDGKQNRIYPVSKPERSRKRGESPSSNSSSSTRQNTQKRINTTSHPGIDDRSLDNPLTNPMDTQANAGVVKDDVMPDNGLVSSALVSIDGTSLDKHEVVELEDILYRFEQTNISEAEMKDSLYKTFHIIETCSSETWDRCFDRLIILLLDIATGQKNVHAMIVLQKLVVAQSVRAQRFFEPLLGRLIDTMAHQCEEARHLAEVILHGLVRSSREYETTLSTLVPLIISREPPMLPVVLRLVTICFQQYDSLNEVTFLRQHNVADGILSALSQCLSHSCSKVRKNAVDCFVALHFAVKEDNAVVSEYLAAKVEENRRRVVEIFISREQMKRHRVKSS